MKPKTQFFTIYLITIFQVSAIAGPDQNLNQLSWLLGEWRFENKSTVTTETWNRVSDKSFEGYGAIQTSDETGVKIFESLRIVEMSDKIYYIAKVEHNDLPIAFALTEFSDSLAVFENPLHDFPKKISYQLEKNEILSVTVSSDTRRFTLHFKKQDQQENQ